MNAAFSRFACWASTAAGHPVTFGIAVLSIGLARTSERLWGWPGIDDQNYAISVISLVLLMLLQHSQNRDGDAIQAKLDELVIAVPDADSEVAGMEKKP